jgi:uncharacterized protein (DUF433 family)
VIKSQVIDHGDGPKIEGTRITVYTVLDYLQSGRTRDWIAAMLNLSSEQVQAAMDYIHEHDIQVHTDYERIMSRIQQGHSDEAEGRLQANRAKVQARLANQKTSSR